MDRRGFTLIEVLLVLAIVAIIAALTWPAIERPLANRRLHSAADEVRTEWCEARIEAMRSGHTYAFRYEVGGDRFYTELDNGRTSHASRGTSSTVNLDSSGTKSGGGEPADAKTLPKGIRFLGDSGGKNTTPAATSMPTQEQPGAGWSEPIFFYPDGTASDVQLVLSCNQNCAVRVSLRGITATATVADAGSTLE